MSRDAILAAIVAKMETIRPENGYLTDAGLNVEQERTDLMGPSESKLIDVVAGSWEADDTSNSAVRRWVRITIMYACQGSDAAAVRDDILKDVIKAVYADLTWGGAAILTEEVGGAADKDVAETVYAWGEVDLRVLYDTVEGEI